MQLTVPAAPQPVPTSRCRCATAFRSFPSRAISCVPGISPHGLSSLAGRRPGASLCRRGPPGPCPGRPLSCALASILSWGGALHLLRASYCLRRERAPGSEPSPHPRPVVPDGPLSWPCSDAAAEGTVPGTPSARRPSGPHGAERGGHESPPGRPRTWRAALWARCGHRPGARSRGLFRVSGLERR